MFRRFLSRRSSNRRPQMFRKGRALRYETMEGRMMLSASGFANGCAPVLDDDALDQLVPQGTLSPGVEIAFEFDAVDVVSDGGDNPTEDPTDIRFILDPDVEQPSRNNGATPEGAELSEVSPGSWRFEWTPTQMQQGTFRLFIIATDDAGGTGVPLSDAYAFELTVDNQPTLDLNGDDDSGVDFDQAVFTEGGPAVPIVDTDLNIPFIMNDTVQSAAVMIDNMQEGEVEKLGISNTGSLIVEYDEAEGVLMLTGTANKSVYEDALRTLTYENTSDSPIATQTISMWVSDGMTLSPTAMSTVTNIGTNDRPDLLQIEMPENAFVDQPYMLHLEATDPDAGDMLVFQILAETQAGNASFSDSGDAPVEFLQVSRDEGDGRFHATIHWTPTEAEGDVSPILFRVSVTDSAGSPDSEEYSIAIENQAPVAEDDELPRGSEFVGEDDPAQNIGNLFSNDDDADGDTLMLKSVIVGGSAVADPMSFTTAKGAAVTIDADGNVTYDPAGAFEHLAEGDFSETDTFDYVAHDGQGNDSGTATVTISIRGENDPPEPNGPAPVFRVDEGAASTPLTDFLDAAKDVDDGDMVSFFGASLPELSAGSLSLAEGVLSFNQEPDEFVLAPNVESDPILFSVRVTDNYGATTPISATVIVVGVDDPPVAVDDLGNATNEDSLLTSDPFSLLSNDTDDGDTTLTVSQVDGQAANVGVPITVDDGAGRMGELTVNPNGTFVFDPRTGFDTLEDGDFSDIEFTYIVSDGNSESTNAATVRIRVNGVNDVPVANDDDGPTFTTDEDTQLTGVNILDNDNDVDGDALFVASFDNRSIPDEGINFDAASVGGRTGTVSVLRNGAITYTPSSDFDSLAKDAVDTVMFNYKPSDGKTAADDLPEATLTITVNGVNDGPTIDEAELAAVIQAAAGLGSLPDLSGPIEIPNNVPLNFDFSSVVSDPDTPTGDLGYSRDGNIPVGLNEPSIDGDGQFSWTPNASSTPTDVTFTLNVIDATVADDIVSDGIQLTFRLVNPII